MIGVLIDIFETDPKLFNVFKWNEATNQIEGMDFLSVKMHLARQWDVTTSNRIINDIMKSMALKNSYHPIKQYLESLKWDGIERLDNWGKKRLIAIITEVYNGDLKHFPKTEDYYWAEAYYLWKKDSI